MVPIDAQYSKNEVSILVEFSDAKDLIIDSGHLEPAEELKRELHRPLRIWSLESSDKNSILHQTPSSRFEPHFPKPDDLMSIIFTSGTTGDPKGVQLTSGNIGSNVESILKAIRITEKDNLLNILPLHHAYASTACVFSPLAAGATVTFCDSLKGPDLMAVMQETGVTIFPGVPQLFTLLYRSVDQKIDSSGLLTRSLFKLMYTISRSVRTATSIRLGKLFFGKIHRQFGKKLRFLVSGGAKLDPKISEYFLDLGFLMLEGYGLTETSPVISFTSPSKPKPGSVGVPLEGIEVRIDSPDAEGQGEICMRGHSLMKGYYRKPEATAEVIREGWFHTGDLGYLDASGQITITGRAKEILVLPSGKNIYPDEVEAHYQKTLFVKEICILPKNGPDGTVQGLCAVVVPDMEQVAQLKVTRIRERIGFELGRIGLHLPSYMGISDLVILPDPLPRTRLGKLRRTKIEEMVRRQKESGDDQKDIELSPETKELLEHPASQQFLKRLQEITGNPGPFLPGQNLEIDLGLDSLTQIQITAVLESEFGVDIPDEEAADIQTVGDLLKRVLAVDQRVSQEKTSLQWSKRLTAPSRILLEEMFHLDRGWLRQLPVNVVKWILIILVRILFRARIEGLERLPRKGAVLLCPNHQSYIDAVLLFALLPGSLVKRLIFIAFGEIFRRPPLSWVIRPARIVLTGGADTLADSLKLAAQGLNRGMGVCIFPEGTRSPEGEISPPRLGAGILACELKVPIVPILIEGSIETLSPSKPKFRPCPIRISVGETIYPPESQPSGKDYQEMMDQWEQTILKLKASGE